MSRVIKIKGTLRIENVKLAQDAINSFNYKGIKIINNQFLFNEYDYYDGMNKHREINDIENKYKKLITEYYQKIEEVKRKLEQEKINAELDRLEEIRSIEEELRLIEEEKIKIEVEKKVIREAKRDLIIANAKKQGYRVKKELTQNNTIKLVLQKRVY